MQDLVQLIDIITALEEGLATEEFSENTTNRPYVDGFGVTLEAQHDFRSTVPSRSNVFGHVAGIFFRIHGETSGKTKITDLEFAISVDEEISWLQISVEHIGGVNVLETAKNLVDEGLEMRVGKWLSRPDDGGQIALHEFLVQVALIEVFGTRNVHIVKTCYVSVSSKMLQQLDLAQCALSKNLLAEDIGNLLDGYTLTGLVVGSGTDDAVGSLAQLLGDIVAPVNDELLREDLEDLSVVTIVGHIDQCIGRGVGKKSERV